MLTTHQARKLREMVRDLHYAHLEGDYTGTEREEYMNKCIRYIKKLEQDYLEDRFARTQF